MSAALEAARAKRRAMADAGETVERLDPLQKAKANPSSRKLAIAGKCFDCVGADCDPAWRKRIGECPVTKCPLHPVRPYQRGEGEDDGS